MTSLHCKSDRTRTGVQFRTSTCMKHGQAGRSRPKVHLLKEESASACANRVGAAGTKAQRGLVARKQTAREELAKASFVLLNVLASKKPGRNA
jgi:hypothetical protein